MSLKKIAIVAGGDSGEYDVSIKSAAVVREYLDKSLYEPFVIVIRGREWKYTEPDGHICFVDKDDFSIETSHGKIFFDAVFNAIHGTPGEDGKLQGYLEMIGIPYTGCDLTTSSVTFNKYLCGRLAASFGLRVAPCELITDPGSVDHEALLRKVGLPCFVKPNNGGSSVGMSKVTDADELPAAIKKAFAEDRQVLVEAFIPGREITCGVINDRGSVRSLPVTEVISKNAFFDYEAKYTDGMAQEITPGNIPPEVEKHSREISEMLYERLLCRGMVRMDYIFNDEGMFFLEVNTVPGLSPNSILPQQAKVAGIAMQDLFSMALEQAMGK